ncbi:hypothetical protein HDU85_005863 [Gaertneriomyces sp. JEL0708]|nr:hypothetical protein HDU85_005863 [Gaertneriomyces sp. JEL0708]
MQPCPKGYHCPVGTIVPRKCESMSSCPEGSKAPLYYGGLVICLIIDLFLLCLVYFKRQHDRNKSLRIHKLLRRFKRKVNSGEGGTEVDTAKQGEQTDKEKDLKVFPVPAGANYAIHNADVEAGDEGEIVVEDDVPNEAAANTSLLVDAFKTGLGGENLQINFTFENLGLKIKGGKSVLQGVTGSIKAGRMTAIMGPSGAGKTTFMNVLMGKVDRTHGKLFINNKESEMQAYKKIIGYVPQEDIMLRELTVRENILHAARIKLPATWTNEQIESYADAVVDALNLTHVANTVIGDETTRGVSGGQRKRVNIGLELAAVPIAMFLDEPTSGLDSTAALSVAQIMKSISRLGLTIVAVIHQPRVEIFREFDDLLMIAPGGRTAYLGPVDEVQAYFESFGFVFDPQVNQADVLMDILSGHGINRTRKVPVEALVTAWESRPKSPSDTVSDTTRNMDAIFHAKAPALVKERGAFWYKQLWHCHNRYLIQTYRSLSALALEIFVGAFAGLLMGIAINGLDAYTGILVEPYSLLSSAPTLWFVPLCGLLIGLIVALAGAPAAVKIFGEEKPVYWREAASGHNRGAYFVGKTIGSIYRLTLASFHFNSIYMFFARPLVSSGNMFLIVILSFFGVYGLSAIVSMVARRENVTLLAAVTCIFAAVFCGFGPTLKDARAWGIIFIWEMSFNKWATEAMYWESVKPYIGVYDLIPPAEAWGFTLDRFGFDLGMMVVIGLMLRVVAFGLMLGLNRDKQR